MKATITRLGLLRPQLTHFSASEISLNYKVADFRIILLAFFTFSLTCNTSANAQYYQPIQVVPESRVICVNGIMSNGEKVYVNVRVTKELSGNISLYVVSVSMYSEITGWMDDELMSGTPRLAKNEYYYLKTYNGTVYFK